MMPSSFFCVAAWSVQGNSPVMRPPCRAIRKLVYIYLPNGGWDPCKAEKIRVKKQEYGGERKNGVVLHLMRERKP